MLFVGVVYAQEDNSTMNVTNDDFESIQVMIDNAKPGDSIYLENKTYYGNGTPIVVDKSINIYGVDSSKTVLNASDKSSIFLISRMLMLILRD